MLSKFLETKAGQWIIKQPLMAWLTRIIIRRKLKSSSPPIYSQQKEYQRSGSTTLEDTLNNIVVDVVEAHGYAGAMLATYEQGDWLPIRAFYIDPQIVSMETINSMEQEISKYTSNPVSLSDPTIAKVNRYNPNCKENLSVRAVNAGRPIVTNELFDLFRPIVPSSAQQIIRGFQRSLQVKQAIAVPFFLDISNEDNISREIVGNLFAIKREEISDEDILKLSAFGKQAATAIEAERRRLQSKIALDLVYTLQTHLKSEGEILQHIVEGIVNDLGYIGAMVGTYEEDDAIPVRAFYIEPRIASMDDIKSMEEKISKFTEQPISITNPDIARVYCNDPKHGKNLSVRAVREGQPITSNDLFDLFRPIAPEASQEIVKGIQKELGIQQVIAVPFFLETNEGGKIKRELVGNLFAATKSRSFREGEIELLRTFGHQAAAGIRNAKLYKKAEDRRKLSETFGRMAFSATAKLQELKNHTSVLKSYVSVLQRLIGQHKFDQENIEFIKEMLDNNPAISQHLTDIETIIDSLHEPWKEIDDEPTDINLCLEKALEKGIPSEGIYFIKIHKDLDQEIPLFKTSSDMLTAAFNVLIENAVDAINKKGRQTERHLWIKTTKISRDWIEITIQDNGIGIRDEHLTEIFDLEWSTKETGLGFGLFWTKDYIEGIGGMIRVDSVWGTGTTFKISLPITK